MKLLAKAGAIFDYINEFLAWVSIILIAFAGFAVCYEVFMRYFLNSPTRWVLEVVANILVFVGLLAAAWVLRQERHAKMLILVARLKPRTQLILHSATSILCAIICLAVAWYGARLVWSQFQEGDIFHTILAPPKAPLYSVVPIGMFLLFIQFVRRTSGYLAQLRPPRATREGSTVRPDN